MLKNKCYLGIDTSNYTTSIALCDEKGILLSDIRRVLSVKEGERGLRQSDALFQHVKNLPECFEELNLNNRVLAGIAVSVSPRPLKDSYMPVFRAGEGQARALSQVTGAPLLTKSHQENHIRAAIYGSGLEPDELHYPILATHFSGGTSELLMIERDKNGFKCDVVGKTLDLNAGQLIDRIGVALGLDFPAGRALETMAQQHDDKKLTISSRVVGADFHFSGQENQAKALMKSGELPSNIAFALFRSISKTLERAIRFASQENNIQTVLFSGGVMSNSIIKETLHHRLKGSGLKLYFSDPKFATDNAVGMAYMAKDAFSHQED